MISTMEDLDLDLDAFIAGIEETAPEEKKTLTCEECCTVLEEVDEVYVCPNCSAQANILQLDETELNYDEQGRVFGQRVKLTERKQKHSIDYGWAWSTDDAVGHVLSLQIAALEKAKLIPDSFRDAVSNMWFKFWLENIAPHIKDEYDENELVPIDINNALKLRDIEVLVKVKDKVMVPRSLINPPKRRVYKYMGMKFCRDKQLYSSESSVSSIESDFEAVRLENSDQQQQETAPTPKPIEETIVQEQPARKPNRLTSACLNLDTISILTLSRTLAFIEATARCTCSDDDPLFAADIIRGCNQYLIPFYDVYKDLPEDMKLNARDTLMFQKQRPPSAVQLSRTSSLLIHKIYRDRMPATLPVPNFAKVLKRFMKDMNLPNELFEMIKDKVTFANFKQTQPKILTNNHARGVPNFPQYDRWVFAILLGQLKILFDLSDESILKQAHVAQNRTITSDDKNIFVFGDWIRQMDFKYRLIFSYDPFVLYHPLTKYLDRLETTPQVYAYIDRILTNRVIATTRIMPSLIRKETSYREELTHFLHNELPRPDNVPKELTHREELEISGDIKHPITDAIRRTKRFWMDEEGLLELIDHDYSESKVVTIASEPKWCIYEGAQVGRSTNLDILQHWPDSFKLLLHIGSFLCVCRPKDLLVEYRAVEDYIFPEARTVKRRTFNRKSI